jgi:hypothetical protein
VFRVSMEPVNDEGKVEIGKNDHSIVLRVINADGDHVQVSLTPAEAQMVAGMLDSFVMNMDPAGYAAYHEGEE